MFIPPFLFLSRTTDLSSNEPAPGSDRGEGLSIFMQQFLVLGLEISHGTS